MAAAPTRTRAVRAGCEGCGRALEARRAQRVVEEEEVEHPVAGAQRSRAELELSSRTRSSRTGADHIAPDHIAPDHNAPDHIAPDDIAHLLSAHSQSRSKPLELEHICIPPDSCVARALGQWGRGPSGTAWA